ncbi:hypothetical protein BD779DRAFT_1680274 [Infundibulicybe gibba]|nr:hypothetical protein BD779DRAFT_1680274 [Infundibulicybe gibba]
MPSPYATDEDSKALWIEQSAYVSTHLAAIAYGFHAIVFAAVIYFMFRQEQSQQRHRRRLGWLIISIALFITGTVSLACSIGFNESAWVTERDYPGGASAFLQEEQHRTITVVGGVATVMASILVDGIMLYRVFVVWNWRWYIMTPLVLLYIAATVFAILRLVQLYTLNSGGMPDLGILSWTMLMATNIILSGTIVIRILMMRQSIRKFLGAEHAAIYTSIAAIVVEAALPFMIASIALLVLFGGKNTTQDLFIPLLVQFACISPLLIILRIFRNQAWSNNTAHFHDDQRNTNSWIRHPSITKPITFATTPSEKSQNSDMEKGGISITIETDKRSI